MLSYPLRLAFQRVRVIRKIRNDFLFSVLRDSKCIRAATVAREIFDTSCTVWISQIITSFIEIKYQNKENNRQWGVMSEETSTSFNVNLNVTMNVICAIPYDISSNPSSICYLCWMNEKTTTTTLAFCASTVPYGLGWIAIGKQ